MQNEFRATTQYNICLMINAPLTIYVKQETIKFSAPLTHYVMPLPDGTWMNRPAQNSLRQSSESLDCAK